MPATTADTLSLVNHSVTVAPLVLLSVADHYGRTAKGTRKRVVGVLLGESTGNNVRVSNSFAGVFQLVMIHRGFIGRANSYTLTFSAIRGR